MDGIITLMRKPDRTCYIPTPLVMAENKLMNRSRSISSCLALLYVASSPALLAAELEEIQVTATKTSQSIQDIPLAVSAFTAQGLDRRGISETTDLSGLVPSLVVISPFGRTQPKAEMLHKAHRNFDRVFPAPENVSICDQFRKFLANRPANLLVMSQPIPCATRK